MNMYIYVIDMLFNGGVNYFEIFERNWLFFVKKIK